MKHVYFDCYSNSTTIYFFVQQRADDNFFFIQKQANAKINKKSTQSKPYGIRNAYQQKQLDYFENNK